MAIPLTAVEFNTEGTEQEHRDHRDEHLWSQQMPGMLACWRQALPSLCLEAMRDYVVALDSEIGVATVKIGGSKLCGDGFLFAGQK